MITTRNRKQLPEFGVLDGYNVDITLLLKFCYDNGYFNTDLYNDINVSSNSKMKAFVVANTFSKENFFKDSSEDFLESEVYKQKYLTEIYDDVHLSTSNNISNNILERTKRLNKNSTKYVPEADEHNYGKRNDLVVGEVSSVLNMFKGQLARVRLAYLSPNFSLKPHVDYDPSYITRYHIPLLTNQDCLMCVKAKGITRKMHFPANGKVYFLNAGHIHWAENNSNEGRIHLIIDTKNQEDLRWLQPI